MPTGFLVVIVPDGIRFPQNERYRGVDRRPPVDLDLAEHFRDPYLYSDDIDETGLISNLVAAQNILLEYSSVMRVEDLEIVASSDHESILELPSIFPAGFDVAGSEANFWSILGDFPSGAEVDSFRAKLNDYGLFSDRRDAADYLQAYRRGNFADSDAPFSVWSVAIAGSESR